ncbi:hypothetical protein ABIA95_000146 [Bradyrhizobium sp. LA8.1]
MSTDWYLFSPGGRKSAMVGSDGFSGPKVWPTEYNGDKLLRWAIENNVKDVILVDENDQRLVESEEHPQHQRF